MEFIKNIEYLHKWCKNSAVKWVAILILEIMLAGLAITSPLALLMFLVASIATILFFVKPEYSLYILVLLIIPGRSVIITLYEVSQYISHLFVIVALFYWSVAHLAKTRPAFPNTGCDQPLLIFLAWALLSILWSHNRIVGLEDMLRLSTAVALVFLITAFINEPKTLRIALGVFIFMGIIDAIIAFFYLYSDFFIVKRWTFLESLKVVFAFWPKHILKGAGGRCMGFAPAHATAVTLSFAITFCMMFFFVTQNIRKRMLLFGLTFFLFAVTIGTLTKSMIISILTGTTYVVFHFKPFRKRFFTILFVIFMLTVTAFFLTRIQDIGKSAEYIREGIKIESEELRTTSISGRLDMAKIGLQKLWETGGLGTGIGGFLQYTSSSNMDGSHPSIMWDLGFIGIAVWIWLLSGAYRLFVTAIKNSKNEYYKRMLIVYIGGYVNVLISWFVTFAYADIYIWFYLGIGFALVHLSRTVPFDPNLRLPYSGNGESIVII